MISCIILYIVSGVKINTVPAFTANVSNVLASNGDLNETREQDALLNRFDSFLNQSFEANGIETEKRFL